MDLSYTPEEEAFRARVRAWLEKNVPAPGSLKTLDDMRAWQRKLHAAGFLGAAWPRGSPRCSRRSSTRSSPGRARRRW